MPEKKTYIPDNHKLYISTILDLFVMKNLFKPALSLFLITYFYTFSFAQEKKPLTLDDYKMWNRITNVSLSDNGEWMTYSYTPNEGDSRFFIREVEKDTVFSTFNGKRPNFSKDSEWLAFLTDPLKKEAEQMRKKKQAVNSTLHLYNLNSQAIVSYKDVRGFSFSKASNFVAIQKAKMDKDAKHSGTDLLLKSLNSQAVLNIGNVSSYGFNEEGSHLAYIVDAAGKTGNGVYLIELSTMRTMPIHASESDYSQLKWNDAGSALAFLHGDKLEGKTLNDNNLVTASNLIGDIQVTDLNTNFANLPEGFVISEYRSLSWNKAGTQLFFGIKEQTDVLKKEDELKANVDVWHWKDDVVQSRQMITANRDRRLTHLAVLNLNTNSVLRLQDENVASVSTNENSKWAIARIDTAYVNNRELPGGYADLYAVDTENGSKSLIANNVYNYMGVDPNGDYAVYSKDAEVMLYDFAKKSTSNLTNNTDVDFENKDFDRPVEKPTFGIEGWSKDGEWLFLNHKYDIYAFSLSSNDVLNITGGEGAENEVRFRLVQLDNEERTYDTNEKLLLSAYGEWNKKSGYYELEIGKNPKALLYDDKMIGRPVKAQKADRIVFTQQTFEEYPNYWYSNTSFRRPRQLTDANPQQADFKWGKRVLMDYTDQRGNKLQATLALPADYEEGKKYPMIIYFYEKMSQRHHQYSMPTYDDRPHMSTYASNGYLVLMPDIIYDEGKPGSSALDDITSSAQAAIDLGYADPDRIGLQGHSWGGYQSSFILTQTDMFACVVTGAPLTDLVSMYNVIYKRTGNFNGPIIEWSQGRMGVTPWEDMELYMSQSPIHNAQNISTPFLILHGTADGAVDWNQGLQYYQTARRLGKEVILLSYPDEPHHLGKEENQKDFQIRMKQYFDYYLKDIDAPSWMTRGVKQLDKKATQPENK